MNKLNYLYDDWREASFPSTTTNENVDELHKELILYDLWVAESVIPFIQKGRYIPAVPDVVDALMQFQERGQELLLSVEGSDLDSVRQQLEYATKLYELYSEFLAIGQD